MTVDCREIPYNYKKSGPKGLKHAEMYIFFLFGTKKSYDCEACFFVY